MSQSQAPNYNTGELLGFAEDNFTAARKGKNTLIIPSIQDIQRNALAQFDTQLIPAMQKMFFAPRHSNPVVDHELWVKEASLPTFMGQQMLAYGVATSDTAYRRQILTKLVYHRASLISVGVNIIPVEGASELDMKAQFPSELVLEYPVPEMALPDPQRIEMADFKTVLQKAAMRIPISDESYFRGGNVQFATSIRRASEALAAGKDKEILTRVYSGCSTGTHQTDTSDAEWDDENNGEIISNLADAISKILAYSNITVSELWSMQLVVPAILYGTFLKPRMIEGIQTNLFTYLRTGLGITVWPSRDATTINVASAEDRAIFVPYGVDTAVHYVYTGDNMPVEVKREEGVGNIYNMRQYFRSRVTPTTQDGTTNLRIFTFLDVTSTQVS